jgi:hypothetical protein
MMIDKEMKMNTEEEKRNLETLKRLEVLFNSDLKGMFNEVFADKFVVIDPFEKLEFTEKDKDALIQGQQEFLDAYPDRRLKFDLILVKDDYVVGKGAVTWTDEEKNVQTRNACAIYKLKDGKIVSDTTYMVL